MATSGDNEPSVKNDYRISRDSPYVESSHLLTLSRNLEKVDLQNEFLGLYECQRPDAYDYLGQ